jgi:cytochrome P450 PksS
MQVYPIDLVSSHFHADPFATFDDLRAQGSVVPVKLPIFGRIRLAVTHDACVALLKNHQEFARDPVNAGRYTQQRLLSILPSTLRLLAQNMLGYDEPEHRRLRGLVDQAFQRRTVEAFRPVIEAAADRLLDRLGAQTQVDLMRDFCRDLPLSVICDLLGLPENDHARFKGWLGGLKDTADIAAVLKAVPGVIQVVRYLRRASRPGAGVRENGLIAALRDAATDHGTLSEDELVSMIFLLFGAGQETTTHLLGGGLAALLSHDKERAKVLADPALLPTCVEECLRYVSPVQFTKPRWAKVDTILDGHRLRRGDSIAGLLAAANSDPAKFEDARRFDIVRRPNPHLAFGTGPHFCLGFQLARAEAAIAFERLFSRFPNVRLAINPNEMVWRRRLGIRALAGLPVVLH